MTRALCSGSFDPVTKGHLSVIQKCTEIFDEVYVVMFLNSEKTYCFSEEERLSFLKKSCASFSNVTVDFSRGYVADYVVEHQIDVIVKGIRTAEDLAYEKEVDRGNRMRHPQVKTLFLLAEESMASVSSSEVRRRLHGGESVEDLIPKEILEDVMLVWQNHYEK